jgi:hypothetical protein
VSEEGFFNGLARVSFFPRYLTQTFLLKIVGSAHSFACILAYRRLPSFHLSRHIPTSIIPSNRANGMVLGIFLTFGKQMSFCKNFHMEFLLQKSLQTEKK